MEFQKGIHYSSDLERAVLGICMLEAGAFSRIYGMLEKDCFYSSGHQIVFETMKAMYQAGMPIDSFTVVDQITRVKGLKQIESSNTDYFVVRLTNDVVSSAHVEYHSHIIKTMWMEREMINMTHGGANLSGDIRAQMYEMQRKIQALQEKTAEHDWVDMTQMMVDLYKHQDEMKRTGGMGLPIGITAIDKENGGLHPGQLIVIGARPSVGKSALMGNIALEMAKKDKTVGIVSLEMSNTEIAARLAALDTDTDFSILFRGLYRDQVETDKVYEKIGRQTSTYPIYVTDKTRVNIPEIRAKAEKLKAMHGLDCLMIDYLQLVNVPEGSPRNRNRENDIAEMSRGCKIMAKELKIPIVLLCQLNRESTKRKGNEKYPQLSDLRESGAIEQDADVVMFLHSDFMAGYEQDSEGNSTRLQADVVVRKWRNGKSNFIIPMDFDPPKMKFTERQTFISKFVPVSNNPYEVDKTEENPF